MTSYELEITDPRNNWVISGRAARVVIPTLLLIVASVSYGSEFEYRHTTDTPSIDLFETAQVPFVATVKSIDGVLGDSGWQLVNPIAVYVERELDGSFCVSDDLFAVYGCGSTEESAEEDYRASLVTYYSILAKSSNKASHELFAFLQRYVQPMSRS